jgi:signal transduction histidine kinase
MSDVSLSAAILQMQGYAVFEYLGDGLFRPVGEPAAWYREVLGEEAASEDLVRLAEKFPFLENFLLDAEEFWNSKSAGRAESGTWIEKAESGRDLAVEAGALWLAGKRILFMQNPQSQYDERYQVLQRARDWLLEHERLQREVQKKEILLHCIIHDLSQPLTAMRGCFALLALSELPADMREVVEIAERQSQKQEAMIRGILEVFSAELAAQQAFDRDPEKAPDIARCAQKTVEAFGSAFAERGTLRAGRHKPYPGSPAPHARRSLPLGATSGPRRHGGGL